MKLIIAALAVCFASAVNALTITFDHNPVYLSGGSGAATSNGFIYDYSTVYLTGNHLALPASGFLMIGGLIGLLGFRRFRVL